MMFRSLRGKINQVFAIWRSGELSGAKNKKANRFEPMVVYLATIFR